MKRSPSRCEESGKALPPANMTVPVIYCLRNTALTTFRFGIPELAACALAALFQIVKRNMYPSIIAGTIMEWTVT